jgi:DNA-directed RNA polymerase specialized sigma24 family protein
MQIDADVVADARKLNPTAVREVLKSEVTQVYRIAYALAGRWDVGRGVARFVLNRSVRMMPKWKPDDDPANWYHRFTVMTSRRSAHHRPDTQTDVLVQQAAPPTSAEYVAFVAALRLLEPQQREAFLLWHGEKLNPRYCALAMDCSTEAAQNHLRAAEDALRLVAGARYDQLVKQLEDAYAHLTPEADQLVPTVNNVVFRQVRMRRWLRRILLLVELIAIAALAWGGWKVYQVVRS